jgi:L-fuconolactonase
MTQESRMSPTPEFRGNTPRRLEELRVWTYRRREEALEPDLPIIDPHHHVWDNEHGRYELAEFLEDLSTGHNVVATVFSEVKAMYRAEGPDAMKPVGQVEYVNGIAAASASGRYGKARICEGIVGFADLTLADEVQPVLEALLAAGNGRLRGIRHGTPWDDGAAAHGRSFPPRHLMLDPSFRRGFARLAPMGLVFDAWMFFHQLPDLIDLAAAFPDTSIVIDHTGGPMGIPPHENRDATYATWRAHIRALSAYPNLTMKLGGLGMLYGGWDFHEQSDPPSSEQLARAWRPYIEASIEAFGPARCMFESNFPVDKQSCGYGELWNAFKRITEGCSAGEKAALYHDTASRIYRLGR